MYAKDLRPVRRKTQSKYPQAIADFTAAMGRGAATSLVYANRGNAYRLAGDHRRALADLTEAIRLDPKNTTAYQLRARVHEALNDPARARADDQAAARLGAGK